MFESNKFKMAFNEIKNLRENIEKILSSLSTKVDLLNSIYSDMLNKNICEGRTDLDSFHFQKINK